jgi:hypothetical protein
LCACERARGGLLAIRRHTVQASRKQVKMKTICQGQGVGNMAQAIIAGTARIETQLHEAAAGMQIDLSPSSPTTPTFDEGPQDNSPAPVRRKAGYRNAIILKVLWSPICSSPLPLVMSSLPAGPIGTALCLAQVHSHYLLPSKTEDGRKENWSYCSSG